MWMGLNMNKSFLFALPLLLIILIGSSDSRKMVNHDLSIQSLDDFNLSLPEGFKIELFASGLGTPRQMTETDDGYIIVGTIKEGDIYALKDTDGNGQADYSKKILSSLEQPSGIAFNNGSVFFSEISKISKIIDIDSKLNNREQSFEAEVVNVIDNLPADTWHGRKWLKFGADGGLYFNIGAPCNVCLNDDDRYATILKFIDGEYSVYARGVRNSVGFDFHPQTNKLFFTDNGRDWLGDDSPSCELNIANQAEQFFGFPYHHGKDVQDPEFGNISHGYEIIKPIFELGPHVAPTGADFYSGNMFPDSYKNNLFVTLHGSWNRSQKSGYKVVRIIFDADDQPKMQDFLVGFLKGEEVLGRPSSPFEMSDGSLLISDDKLGNIYRISYEG